MYLLLTLAVIQDAQDLEESEEIQVDHPSKRLHFNCSLTRHARLGIQCGSVSKRVLPSKAAESPESMLGVEMCVTLIIVMKPRRWRSFRSFRISTLYLSSSDTLADAVILSAPLGTGFLSALKSCWTMSLRSSSIWTSYGENQRSIAKIM
ncbi:hypothetical protein GH714_014000 [Hevea brasiliensis]|uniref:Uncharacterized protein n=1 Tax=Hevea brasiliensis TaxID=3981 RepID=A0A6A6NH05_HEVBR|nr:hypothetical protein GH714_014000 [Hevea brasiliensis]